MERVIKFLTKDVFNLLLQRLERDYGVDPETVKKELRDNLYYKIDDDSDILVTKRGLAVSSSKWVK